MIESPKQTIVFFGVFEFISKDEIKYQWSILLALENSFSNILLPSSIKEKVLELGCPDNLSGVEPK